MYQNHVPQPCTRTPNPKTLNPAPHRVVEVRAERGGQVDGHGLEQALVGVVESHLWGLGSRV